MRRVRLARAWGVKLDFEALNALRDEIDKVAMAELVEASEMAGRPENNN